MSEKLTCLRQNSENYSNNIICYKIIFSHYAPSSPQIQWNQFRFYLLRRNVSFDTLTPFQLNNIHKALDCEEKSDFKNVARPCLKQRIFLWFPHMIATDLPIMMTLSNFRQMKLIKIPSHDKFLLSSHNQFSVWNEVQKIMDVFVP